MRAAKEIHGWEAAESYCGPGSRCRRVAGQSVAVVGQAGRVLAIECVLPPRVLVISIRGSLSTRSVS